MPRTGRTDYQPIALPDVGFVRAAVIGFSKKLRGARMAGLGKLHCGVDSLGERLVWTESGGEGRQFRADFCAAQIVGIEPKFTDFCIAANVRFR